MSTHGPGRSCRRSRWGGWRTGFLASLSSVFVFTVLLFVRPFLRIASLSPRRALHDPYYHAAFFYLTDSYVGRDFLQDWTWETFDDPTHGRVNYVDQPTALANNLTFVSDNKFVMRADPQNIVPPEARGRGSVRIRSNKAYEESVTVLDLQHMPEGCATWPAFWSLSQKGPWPNGGEIDIIEGVNLAQQNQVSLHTSPNCAMSDNRWMAGTASSTNCDTNWNYNQGCGVQFAKPASYGAAFNAAGGGYFALVRTGPETGFPGVRVWFWSRSDPSVPPEIRFPPPTSGPGSFNRPNIFPNPYWGLPEAEFPLYDQCDYAAHFDPHTFVFDLTFCGDWAGDGSDYPKSGCPGSCTDLVDNHPEAFQNAYWEVNAMRIYTPM